MKTVNRRLTIVLARYGIPAGIAVLLFAGLRLYRFTGFWLDDFNNIYWIRREGFWRLLADIINPASLFFRPLGMLVYWIMFRFAAFNSVPYYLLSSILHAINTGLLFLFLRQSTKSQYAAGLAVVFFAFRTTFGDVYWSFANIFQLLAFGLVMTGLLLYARFGYSLKETLALTAIYVLAIRAGEQAVLLPILWFAYEWLVRRKLNVRRLWLRYSVFAVVMAWFMFLKITTMQDVDPTRPYYLDLSVLTFGRGYGWYFNTLFQTHQRWGGWFTLSALLAIAFAVTRNRLALFFLAFTYVTLVPYVFLVNHRFELYWYLPFVGLTGLLAVGINASQRLFRRITPRPVAAFVMTALFIAVAAGHFIHEERRGRAGRGYLYGLWDEYRAFLTDVRSLPDGATVRTLYFTAIPRHMDEGTLLSGTQFALDRMDVETQIVQKCPTGEVCVAFENGRLRRLQGKGG
jgi:hypothetical protein